MQFSKGFSGSPLHATHKLCTIYRRRKKWFLPIYRYIAVRKPVRYFTVQTRTRCQCWMAFTWISSAMLCCPPLLEFGDPVFDKDAAVCMLDWQGMAAYSVTLSILVLGPSLITILYTYVYIYGAIRRLRRGFLAHDKVNLDFLTRILFYFAFFCEGMDEHFSLKLKGYVFIFKNDNT